MSVGDFVGNFKGFECWCLLFWPVVEDVGGDDAVFVEYHVFDLILVYPSEADAVEEIDDFSSDHREGQII